MSVLVKGMDELPEDGTVLVVRHYDDGKIYIKYAGMYGYSMQLVKLPDKHGRLVDADALIHELNNSHYPGAPYIDAGISIAIGKVCDADTIVEAEDSE